MVGLQGLRAGGVVCGSPFGLAWVAVRVDLPPVPYPSPYRIHTITQIQHPKKVKNEKSEKWAKRFHQLSTHGYGMHLKA